ncbi:hypothetical protein C7H09_11655 [Marinobacter fuscus]|uniref:Uncharacterized protein n=1 Tax=Marinobacter fuscus TaxID=2109942 RepID=A0A2T1K756_9GAMM|nr:hypothetical protein [Marinobacter fuscus]PSF05991.1 hypothetical protein C7H09_11655 [Marinobacter fuscus]
MVGLSIGAGIAAWYVALTLLRRVMMQPELARNARLWLFLSVGLVAMLFALVFSLALAAVGYQLFDVKTFAFAFMLFALLSFITGVFCIRKVLP